LGLVFFAIAAVAAPASAQDALRFAVVGDTPYTAEDRVFLWKSLVPAIKASDYPFIIHVGDIIGGADGCNTDKIRAWRDEIYSWKPGRVFYTPGDNEWTDCDRPKDASEPAAGTPATRRVLEANLGKPLPELDRLDLLRRTFFPAALDLPADWAFSSQPNFPENMRWAVNGVQFATLHMVSTNNGRAQIRMDDVQLALAQVAARDEANRVWLELLFRIARRDDATAVVIATQADVTNPDGEGPCLGANLIACDAFALFREQLKRLARRFAKPVLLVHGDTNPYCLDRGFGGPGAPNCGASTCRVTITGRRQTRPRSPSHHLMRPRPFPPVPLARERHPTRAADFGIGGRTAYSAAGAASPFFQLSRLR